MGNPTFRTDLITKEVEENGERFVVAVDAVGGEEFRFFEIEFRVAQAFNGARSLDDVSAWALEELGLEIPPSELEMLLRTLDDKGFLAAETQGQRVTIPSDDGVIPEDAFEAKTTDQASVKTISESMPPANAGSIFDDEATRAVVPKTPDAVASTLLGAAANRSTAQREVPSAFGKSDPSIFDDDVTRAAPSLKALEEEKKPPAKSNKSMTMMGTGNLGIAPPGDFAANTPQVGITQPSTDMFDDEVTRAVLPGQKKVSTGVATAKTIAPSGETLADLAADIGLPSRPTTAPPESLMQAQAAPLSEDIAVELSMSTPAPATNTAAQSEKKVVSPSRAASQSESSGGSFGKVILLVLLLAGLGAGGYFAYEKYVKKTSLSPSPSTTSPAPQKKLRGTVTAGSGEKTEVLSPADGKLAFVVEPGTAVTQGEPVAKFRGYAELEKSIEKLRAKIEDDYGGRIKKATADIEKAEKSGNTKRVESAKQKISETEDKIAAKQKMKEKSEEELKLLLVLAPESGVATPVAKPGTAVTANQPLVEITPPPLVNVVLLAPQLKLAIGAKAKVRGASGVVECTLEKRNAKGLSFVCPAQGLTVGETVEFLQ